jgi:sugar O-acyltransferase (sialic acid O-acetyltransferase NeuD family)
MSKIIIIGAGGHAKVLIFSLKALHHEIIGILDSAPEMFGRSVFGIPIIGKDDSILEYSPDIIKLVNGVGSVSSMEKRKKIYDKFKNIGYLFASVIYPSAMVMNDVQLGEGVQIMAGAIVQRGCIIGDNSIINTGAILDHDCKIGNHVHVAPGVVMSGDVIIGDKVHIGTAATIIQGIRIGENTVIGAGAVVLKDIPAGVHAFGVPATISKL